MGTGSLLATVIGMIAVGAWLVAAWSIIRAWSLSERHPPYRALGLRRFVVWTGTSRSMPAEALPHLKRLYLAFAVFFASLIAGIATGVISARS